MLRSLKKILNPGGKVEWKKKILSLQHHDMDDDVDIIHKTKTY